MNSNNLDDINEMDETMDLPRVRHTPPSRKKSTHVLKKMTRSALTGWDSIAANIKNFTYQPSRHESEWLMSSLGEFYDQRWFEDILMMVKGGKEASVYLCRSSVQVGVPLIAAKVYRPRRFRNLKNDHIYREGRSQVETDGKIILDDGKLHAMAQKTRFGMELLHESWLGHEYKTMELLAKAGADIPRPYASGANAILMQYIGDEVAAAPTLNTISLSSTEARVLFERVVHNIDVCLKAGRIHADLSPVDEGEGCLDFGVGGDPWVVRADAPKIDEWPSAQVGDAVGYSGEIESRFDGGIGVGRDLHRHLAGSSVDR